MHCSRQIAGLAAIAALGLAACSPDVTSPAVSSGARIASSVTTTGNGAPSGAHYTLNIIGVAKNLSMPAISAGDVIFVGLGTTHHPVTTDILLFAGTFEVLDKNGTDGTASFQLPAPGHYTVWARALGTPGGQAKITTCAWDAGTSSTICSTLNEVFVRGTGHSSFENVTTELTTISLSSPIAACGTQTVVSLFDSCLQGYFWQYDNNGLKVLQIRFYPV
jgi:hypothetical protein